MLVVLSSDREYQGAMRRSVTESCRQQQQEQTMPAGQAGGAAAATAAASAAAGLQAWQQRVLGGLQHNCQQLCSNLDRIQRRWGHQWLHGSAPAAQRTQLASLSHFAAAAAAAPPASPSYGASWSGGGSGGSTSSTGSTTTVSREEVGRATWTFLHTLAAQYPERPTRQQQRDVRNLVGTGCGGGGRAGADRPNSKRGGQLRAPLQQTCLPRHPPLHSPPPATHPPASFPLLRARRSTSSPACTPAPSAPPTSRRSCGTSPPSWPAATT